MWRKWINRWLEVLSQPLGWNAIINKPRPQHVYRCLRITRRERVRRPTVRGLTFGLALFNRALTGSLIVTLRHDVNQTIALQVTLPFLIGFRFSLDIGLLPWIEQRAGRHRAVRYGGELTRQGGWIGWGWGQDLAHAGVGHSWLWRDFHGRPTVQTVAGEPVELEFTQPWHPLFPPSKHRMVLVPRTTRRHWTRFWKRDEVQEGYEVIIDEPPAVPPQSFARLAQYCRDGLYGMFVPATSVRDAVEFYTDRVQRLRSA